MYGHVCETGGTREVLPPRPLQRFTFKDLLESQDPIREEQSKLYAWTAATNKIKGDLQGAKVCCKETYTAQDCAAGWR